MKIPFIKMHGAGNDFVMLSAIDSELPLDLSGFSKKICHRNFGIGADQVLVLQNSHTADFKMDIYNADGGRVEMCGNGIRCFVKYIRDLGLSQKTDFNIETLGGIIKPQIITNHAKTTKDTIWVRVNMGEPVLEGRKIPVNHDGRLINHLWQLSHCTGLDQNDPQKFYITTISMGNPHCVIFVDDVQSFPVAKIGSAIEQDPFFPKRVNVEFVQVKSKKQVLQRTWERGSGETLACGTGASAVAVASILNQKTERQLTVSLKGGDLDLEWDEATNCVFKTGPATTVFEGEIDW